MVLTHRDYVKLMEKNSIGNLPLTSGILTPFIYFRVERIFWISLVNTSALSYTREIFGCFRLYHGHTKHMFVDHR